MARNVFTSTLHRIAFEELLQSACYLQLEAFFREQVDFLLREPPVPPRCYENRYFPGVGPSPQRGGMYSQATGGLIKRKPFILRQRYNG